MDADLKEYLVNMESRILGRLDAGAKAFTANLSDLRTELLNRFDGLDRRMDAIEKRVASLGLQFSTFSTAQQQLYNDHQQTLATQYAQQVAIDQLAARVKKLEDERNAK